MQFQFSFKHMESSQALSQLAETKIKDKVSKFVTKPIEAHVTFVVERHDHIVTSKGSQVRLAVVRPAVLLRAAGQNLPAKRRAVSVLDRSPFLATFSRWRWLR